MSSRPVVRDQEEIASEHQSVAADTVLLAFSVVSMIISCIVLSARNQAWMDEIFTWKEASDPSLRHLFHAIQHGADGGQPLFYATVWLWDKAFGGSVLSLRLYSCIAMCGALIVTWKTIRRFYGLWATAFGVLMIWCASGFILDQNAEARFYGLYMLAVAISLYAYVRLTEQAVPGKGLLAGVVLAQAALVLTHVLGIIYSGLILLALMFFDMRQGRLRWKIYLLYASGWLALLCWIPAIRASMAAGKPHGWILMPTFHELVDTYSYGFFIDWLSLLQSHTQGWLFVVARHLGQLLIVVPLAVVVAVGIRSFASRELGAVRKTANPLLPVAFALLLMPIVLFPLSHLITPIFVDRYMLPTGIGLAIVLTVFADAAGADRRSLSGRVRFLWITLTVALLICPIATAQIAENYPRVSFLDVPSLDREVPSGALLVADWEVDFSRLMRYSLRPESSYFLLDWPSALAGPRSFVLEYHLMRAYQEVGYYGRSIQDQRKFLCDHADFYVLDAWDRNFDGENWFARVIRQTPQFEWKAIGTLDAPTVKRTLFLVHRTEPLSGCGRP